MQVVDHQHNRLLQRLHHAMAAPLAPFVDALPLPSRLIAVQHDGRLTVGIRAGTHRFHRDLPVSSIRGFEGTVPGPTIEAEPGRPVTVEWRNELESPFPVLDTVSPEPADADGVPVQAVPTTSSPSRVSRSTAPSQARSKDRGSVTHPHPR